MNDVPIPAGPHTTQNMIDRESDSHVRSLEEYAAAINREHRHDYMHAPLPAALVGATASLILQGIENQSTGVMAATSLGAGLLAGAAGYAVSGYQRSPTCEVSRNRRRSVTGAAIAGGIAIAMTSWFGRQIKMDVRDREVLGQTFNSEIQGAVDTIDSANTRVVDIESYVIRRKTSVAVEGGVLVISSPIFEEDFIAEVERELDGIQIEYRPCVDGPSTPNVESCIER